MIGSETQCKMYRREQQHYMISKMEYSYESQIVELNICIVSSDAEGGSRHRLPTDQGVPEEGLLETSTLSPWLAK